MKGWLGAALVLPNACNRLICLRCRCCITGGMIEDVGGRPVDFSFSSSRGNKDAELVGAGAIVNVESILDAGGPAGGGIMDAV